MIERLISTALRQRFLIIVLTIGAAALGFWAFQQLKIEAYPDPSDTQVVFITQFPGHSAEEMEQQVSIPIERAMNGLPNVIARRSRSIFGLSDVELTFAYGTDDYFARQVALEKLRDVNLPDGADCEMEPLITPAGEVYRYVVEGPGHDAMELRELQDWVITPRFFQEDGVGDVETFGGLFKQYQIEVDPLKLEKYNMTISQIAAAVRANNQNAGGALVDNRQQSMVVRGVGLVDSTADIENIVLSASNGAPVFIRDIGRVRIGPKTPQNGIYGLDSETGGLEGLVVMRRGENPSEVLKGIKSAVEDLNSTRLPPGVRLRPIYDRTDLVNNTLHTVSHTLLEGLTIVFLVLFFFLGSMRAAVLTAIVIPLSLLFAFLCMYVCWSSRQPVEPGSARFRHHRGRHAGDGGIHRAPALHGQDRESQRLRGDPRGGDRDRAAHPVLPGDPDLRLYSAVHAGAGGAAVVHSHGFHGVRRPAGFAAVHRHGGARAGHLSFQEWRQGLAESRAGMVDRPLRPEYQVRSSITPGALRSPPSPSRPECSPWGPVWAANSCRSWTRASSGSGPTCRPAHRSPRPPKSLPRCAGSSTSRPRCFMVGSQSGRVEEGTDPFGPNRIELLVTLRPYSEWPRGKVKKDLVEELSRRLSEHIPGANFNFTQPIIDMVTEAVTGSSADLAVIFSGPDLKTLRRYALQGLGLLRGIPGAADTSIEQEADQPQLRIDVNRQALARYAINIADVQDLIEMAIGGKALSVKFEGERQFDIAARYIPEARVDASAIGDILVHAPGGERVPLSQLADIHVVDGASMIARRENRRQITVRINIRGRDQGSFVAEAQRVLRREMPVAEGIRSRVGRAVRESRPRPPPSVLHHAGHHRHHLRPALLGLSLGHLCRAGAAERAFFGRGRRAGALPARHQFERFGGRWLHLPVRRSGDERGAIHLADEPAAAQGRLAPEGGRGGGRANPTPAALDPDRGGDARHGSGRAGHGHRFGHTTSAGHGCARAGCAPRWCLRFR